MAVLIGLAVLVLDLVAIVDIVKGGKDNERKFLWIALILLLPFLGMVIYFIVDRRRLA